MTWDKCRVAAGPLKSVWIGVSSAKHATDIRIERHVKGRRLLLELRARTVYDCTTDRKLKDKKHAMSAITVL